MATGIDGVRRRRVVSMVAVGIVLVYLVRLFALQAMSEDYKKNADSNAFLRRIQYPARGVMRDREGRLLVYNRPSYDLMVVADELRGLDTTDFCATVGITRADFERRMAEIKDRRRNPGYSRHTRQLFMGQLSAEELSPIGEKLFRFGGVYVQRRTRREYEVATAAQVLGDIAEVSPSEMEADDYYQRGDFIGKQGVERAYEKDLRGEKGVEVLLRDAKGRIKGRYRDGALDTKPVAGRDLKLGLDRDLQLLGERLMEGKIGSIVAIEPASGEILCMVTSPTYDPRLMSGRERGAHLLAMQRDSRKPLLNRAVAGQYPPGSTFKTTQALTFLEEGIVTASTAYPCHRGFVYRGLRVGCHGHASPAQLVPAIGTSCNAYFCWGLYHMFSNRTKYRDVQEAMTVWKDYMVSMGFGYKLGVDLPGERRGLIPNAQFYDKAYRGSWNGLTVISISIGQGEVTATPLQIANLAATIANRGWFITPHVVKEVEGRALDSAYTQRRHTMVERRHYETVVEGMRRAVVAGTCRRAALPDIEVCGKTGTAQNRGHDHSVFMGFAPKDEPRIAVAVYVENGGWGAEFGVPIGALMMEQYLKGGLSAESEKRAEEMRARHISYGNEER